ncbi:hypothetical protein BH20CHL6_BH20CHL6_01440 [soil metagenome]
MTMSRERRTADRPEIRSLAEEIVASQQAEIDQMEMWLASWYPDAS